MLHIKFGFDWPSGFRRENIIGLLVLEKKIFKVFAVYSHSGHLGLCDLDHLYKLSFTLPKNAPHRVWL